MFRPLLLTAVICAAALGNGCLFSKKSNRPKEGSALASETEEAFRQRWLQQRTNELVAQGANAEAARSQASTEFRERFAFNQPGRK
jgi:hypothetical protein